MKRIANLSQTQRQELFIVTAREALNMRDGMDDAFSDKSYVHWSMFMGYMETL